MSDASWAIYEGVKHNVLEILRMLRPQHAVGVSKARFGSPNDGGYVHLDAFGGVDAVFSFGIEMNASWDLDIISRGVERIYQFDHTVDAPFPNDERFVFSKTMIGPSKSGGRNTIEELVRVHDKARVEPNLFLKIDIENYEWPCFDATSDEALGRFSQIVGEFHNFEALTDESWRYRVHRVLSKLARHFGVVHVHANNFASQTNIEGLIFPNVLEVSFANRNVFKMIDSVEYFPGPLDRPCDPAIPDIELGNFNFDPVRS